MPVWGLVYFQDGNSFVMEQLLFFHDFTMLIMVGVMVLVGYFLMVASWNYFYSRGIYEGQQLEGLWTVLPGLMLILIVFPSLSVLYYMEEGDFMGMSVKVMGHQWFWSYEYMSLLKKEMESYMLPFGKIRLLEADNWLIIPFGTGVSMIITSVDVIHSWAVPAMGVKMDAVPGRLNQVFMMYNRPGTFVGQCSEICGANHSFMPVTVLVSSVYDFLKSFI